MEPKLSPKFSYGLASLSSGVLAVALLTPATAATPAPAESGEPISETKKISSIKKMLKTRNVNNLHNY